MAKLRERDAGLSEPEVRAWGGFLTTHARLVRRLDEELRAAHGMPLGTFEVLIRLSHAPGRPLGVRRVAHASELIRSGLDRLVDRLVRDGLVERERCGEDARGAWAVLTPAGAKALKQAMPTHIEGVRRLFLSSLDEDDHTRLADVWDRI